MLAGQIPEDAHDGRLEEGDDQRVPEGRDVVGADASADNRRAAQLRRRTLAYASAAAGAGAADAGAEAKSCAATVSAPRLALHLASAAASDQASSRVPPHEESMSPIG